MTGVVAVFEIVSGIVSVSENSGRNSDQVDMRQNAEPDLWYAELTRLYKAMPAVKHSTAGCD